MSVWGPVALVLVSGAVSGFLGNFAYAMLWHYLGRWGWKEAALVNWAATMIRYSARAIPGVIVLLLGITIFGWWGTIGSKVRKLIVDAPQAPSSPVLTQPQSPTSVCADAKDSTCFGTVNGPVTINPKTASQPHDHAGVLGSSSDKILLAPGVPLVTVLQVGNSHVFFAKWGSGSAPLFNVLTRDNLTIEWVDGKVAVSTIVRDRTGALLTQIARNEWQVAEPPKTWDLNHNDSALEVKDDRGEVVLQIVAFPGLIRLQGEWWDDQGRGIRLVSTGPGGAAEIAFLKQGQISRAARISPMFLYPSRTHPGELTAFGRSLSSSAM